MVIENMTVNGHRTEGHTLKGVCQLYRGMKCKLWVYTVSGRSIYVYISKKDAITLLESGDVGLHVHTGDKVWVLTPA